MVTIAVESLASCMGCDLAMLDHGASVADMLHELTFVRMPALADRPDACSEATPHTTVGIVFGAVRRQIHVARLRRLRAQVDILLALGTCAVTGGVPAMAFLPGAVWDKDLDESQRVCTVQGPPDSSDPAGAQAEDMLPACLPVNHYVRVDLEVPGCPPHADWIAECLLSLLDARTPELPQRSVCDVCPARRAGGAPLDESLNRCLHAPEAPPNSDLHDLPCLLEQGFLCMGPVTRSGCGGKGQAPRCIQAYAPCRGCHGPAHNRPQPLADYVGVLTAAGYDLCTLPDIPGFLSRFSGMYIFKNYRKDG